MKIYLSHRIKNIIKLSAFTFTLFLLLCFSKQNFESVKSSISIFTLNIIPSLFPFIFFTEVILNTGIIELISKLFGKITRKLL